MTPTYEAGQRFLTLMQSNAVPEGVLRDAATGRLSMQWSDRVFILVHMARSEGPWQQRAKDTLSQLDTELTSALLADSACPDVIREYLETQTSSADDLTPEQRQLLELAKKETGAFELVDATSEEQETMSSGSKPASQAGGVALKTETLLMRVSKMTVPQRVQLGIKGNRDERLLLIRDSNKVVQRAVAGSPRLTENDAEFIAGMRNVSDEVLRMIGTDRRFVRSTVVVRNLVNNPRTPIDITLTLMKFLSPNDLRALAANKNVSDTVRRMAAKILAQKQG